MPRSPHSDPSSVLMGASVLRPKVARLRQMVVSGINYYDDQQHMQKYWQLCSNDREIWVEVVSLEVVPISKSTTSSQGQGQDDNTGGIHADTRTDQYPKVLPSTRASCDGISANALSCIADCLQLERPKAHKQGHMLQPSPPSQIRYAAERLDRPAPETKPISKT